MRWLSLEGGSMRPLLRAGQRVPVRTGVRPGPGDLVLYRVGNALRVHRLAWTGEKSSWIFDDSGTVGWHRVSRSRIEGVVEAGPLGRGFLGLAYGLSVCIVYRVFRFLKTM